MPDPIKPWGTCFKCGKDIALKKDGTLRYHTEDGYWTRRACEGTGKPPGFLPKKFQ